MKSQRLWMRPGMVFLCTAVLWVGSVAHAGQPDPPGQAIGSPPVHEAYLFAHMKQGDYGRLYYEQYPGVSYGLSVASGLEGPWVQVSGVTFFSNWDKYQLPPKVRHGSMMVIMRSEYDTLVAAFGKDEKTP
jgi:hypothetical protein